MDEALGELPIEELEERVAGLAARIAAATGEMMTLLAELDRREAWGNQGFRSLAEWLSWRTGMDLATAREHVRVARKLHELPRVAETLNRGEISYSKVRAITRVAEPETEETLLEMAQHASTAQLERVVRGIRRVEAEEENEAALLIEERRYLNARVADDGMLILEGRLAPEEGALFLRALESARQEVRGKQDGADKERAAALVLMADRSLAGEGRSGAERTQIVVHVDAEVLEDPASQGRCEIEGAGRVSAETARRLGCDASVVAMIHGPNGEIVAGKRSRTVRTPLRRAVSARDEGRCTFPGCGRRIVDAHHVQYWTNGGETVLGNITLLCRFHHVLVHEGGFRSEMENGRPRFFRPDGREVEVAPAPPKMGELPMVARGMAPAWQDGPVDYGWAVETVTKA